MYEPGLTSLPTRVDFVSFYILKYKTLRNTAQHCERIRASESTTPGTHREHGKLNEVQKQC